MKFGFDRKNAILTMRYKKNSTDQNAKEKLILLKIGEFNVKIFEFLPFDFISSYIVNRAFALSAKSFTAMASKIIPNTFLIIAIPPTPKRSSNFLVSLSTT